MDYKFITLILFLDIYSELFFVLENKANSKYITKNQHNNYINSVKRKIMKLDLNINTKFNLGYA